MYIELRQLMQAEAPLVIMPQAVKQVAVADDIAGYVNGASADHVSYGPVEKY